MSRLLAIDHGSQRIGLAVGDSETGVAFARGALRRRGTARDTAALATLARDEGVSTVIVGLPLNMDGSEGSQAATARSFGDALSAAGLTVEYVDERLSSWQARADMAASGRRVDRRSGELDSAAARLLLQQYLDAGRPPAGRAEESR